MKGGGAKGVTSCSFYQERKKMGHGVFEKDVYINMFITGHWLNIIDASSKLSKLSFDFPYQSLQHDYDWSLCQE